MDLLPPLLTEHPLPPDWAQVSSSGAVTSTNAPDGTGPRFSFDAARVLLRTAESCTPDARALAVDTAKELTGPINELRGVYTLDGTPTVDWQHPLVLAAAAAAAAAGRQDAAAAALDAAAQLSQREPGYYGAAWVALGRVELQTTCSAHAPQPQGQREEQDAVPEQRDAGRARRGRGHGGLARRVRSRIAARPGRCGAQLSRIHRHGAAKRAAANPRQNSRDTHPRGDSRDRVDQSHLEELTRDPGTGALLPPASFEKAGYYVNGPVPGVPGPAVIAAHVDDTTGPKVFYRLRELTTGDQVVITRSDGKVVTFQVNAVKQYPKDAFPTDAVYGPAPGSSLRLITCGGSFDAAVRSYRDGMCSERCL